MYYKVVKNNKVLDLLTRIETVRFSKRNGFIIRCLPDRSEGFMSSDYQRVYKTPQMLDNGMNWTVVDLVEIDEHEYNQLKMLNGKSPQEIIDAYTLTLMEEGII